jgi:hypothetical protein
VRIHGDGATLGHVDGDAAIAQGCARHVVPTTAHRDRQVMIPGEEAIAAEISAALAGRSTKAGGLSIMPFQMAQQDL